MSSVKRKGPIRSFILKYLPCKKSERAGCKLRYSESGCDTMLDASRGLLRTFELDFKVRVF